MLTNRTAEIWRDDSSEGCGFVHLDFKQQEKNVGKNKPKTNILSSNFGEIVGELSESRVRVNAVQNDSKMQILVALFLCMKLKIIFLTYLMMNHKNNFLLRIHTMSFVQSLNLASYSVWFVEVFLKKLNA